VHKAGKLELSKVWSSLVLVAPVHKGNYIINPSGYGAIVIGTYKGSIDKINYGRFWHWNSIGAVGVV